MIGTKARAKEESPGPRFLERMMIIGQIQAAQ
jgi:hypothetical protein